MLLLKMRKEAEGSCSGGAIVVRWAGVMRRSAAEGPLHSAETPRFFSLSPSWFMLNSKFKLKRLMELAPRHREGLGASRVRGSGYCEASENRNPG